MISKNSIVFCNSVDPTLPRTTIQGLGLIGKRPAKILELGSVENKYFVKVAPIDNLSRIKTLYFDTQKQLNQQFTPWSFKLSAITVCVNYDDYLSFCVPRNRSFFDKYVVVTDSKNKNVIKSLCQNYDVDIVVTDRFYEQNAKFNKGKGINEGLAVLPRDTWICHLDADVILSKDFRNKVSNLHPRIDTIYGCHRRMCPNAEEFNEYLNGSDNWKKWKYGTTYSCYKKIKNKNVYLKYVPIGYLQLFNLSKKQQPWYPETIPDASSSDVKFSVKWDNHINISEMQPDIEVIHLPVIKGTSRHNWRGRTTPRLIVT